MTTLALKVPNGPLVHKPNHINKILVFALGFLAVLLVSPVQAVAQVWTASDVGSPALPGKAQNLSCTPISGCPLFYVTAAGSGIGGTADQFTFLQQRLTGDGMVSVRVLTVASAARTEVAGVMIRETLAPSSRHVSLLASSAPAALFGRRATTAGATAVTSRSRAAGPIWLRLQRAGATITAWTSVDGSQWTAIGTQTLDFPDTVYVGVAVTSQSTSMPAIGVVSEAAMVTQSPSLPSGWSSVDVGTAPRPGSAFFFNNTFFAMSAAAGVGASGDGFRFVYARVTGDVTLAVRVAASQGSGERQAGIVLRSTLERQSPGVAAFADPTGTGAVMRPFDAAPAAVSHVVGSATSPVWLKIERRGSTVSAYASADGLRWRLICSDTVPLPSDVYAGLFVAAGPGGVPAGAALDHLLVTSAVANRAPTVSLTSPIAGQVFVQGTSITVSAAASDPDDQVARVDVKVNGVTIGSDTSYPYSVPWVAGPAGQYSVLAVAYDFDGASTASASVPISTVSAPSAATSPAPATAGTQTTSPSSTSGTGPWQLSFEPGYDQASVVYYALEVSLASTGSVMFTRNIGKPPIDSTGTSTVNVDTLLSPLPAGSYRVVVRAVSSTGTSDSGPAVFAK